MNFSKIKKCRICDSNNFSKIINLKKQYIQGSFIKKGYPRPYLKKIPLQLIRCKKCSLVQTLYTVNPKILYKSYWYVSGVNKTMTNHLKDIAKTAVSLLKKEKIFFKTKVLDIGCNDCTLLNAYPKKYIKYGIDPSQVPLKNKGKLIKIYNNFFPSKKIISDLKEKKLQIITSIAMFYDLQDPKNFVKSIKKILDFNGIWIFELSYLMKMLKLNSFDTICHEHLEYYSLTALNYLMKLCNMKIFKISFNESNGGSIRCFVTHSDNYLYDNYKDNNFVKKILANEKKLKVNSDKPYKNFFKRIIKIKEKLIILIDDILKKNKVIHIYGASTKGNTIIQWLGINNKKIKYAADRNKEKWGAKTIGSNINIISESYSRNLKPDYYLVLPWHFRSEFLAREKNFLDQGGKLIFPLPEIRVYRN
jgi:2-polyprenyl-3-methyl-5-hydroxy-6-metoxy-1,4-benzoquinol methylase